MPTQTIEDFLGESEKPSIEDFLGETNTKHTFGSVASDVGIGITKTIKNVPKSAFQFGKSIAQPILHPIETIQNIGETLGGGMEKILPSGSKNAPQNIAKFDALLDFFKKRYGGIEELKNTVQTDPVGFAADVSTVLSAGAGTLSKVGQLSKIESLAKAGTSLGKVASATEPLNLATKTVAPIGRVIGEGLGITTGAGGESVRRAFTDTSPEFRAAMRGKTSELNLVEDVKEAFNKLREQRGLEYRTQLPKAVGNPMVFEKQMLALKDSLDKRISDFGIGINKDGTLDFSRAKVSKAGQPIIEEAVDKIRNWGSKEGDFTVQGLDTLKQQLDDLIPTTGQARAFVTSVKSNVRNTLVNNVQDYKKLVGDYEEATKIINDIGSSFSLGGRAGTETILKKLNQTLKQKSKLKKQFIEKLDQQAEGKLISEIAGSQMNPLAPTGSARTTAQLEAIMGGVAVAKGIMNPAYLGILAASSPRVVGEFLNLIGVPSQKMGQIFKEIYTPQRAQVAFQAGRIKTQTNQQGGAK